VKEGIQQTVDRFNDIYLSNGISPLPPIKFYFYEENYQKTFDEDNYKIDHDIDKKKICEVEFRLKHKILVWQLIYLYGHEKGKVISFTPVNELKSYVRTEGMNLTDNERGYKQFETLREGAEHLKNQIIKTYEKFQNL